jgi:hypothetical protein
MLPLDMASRVANAIVKGAFMLVNVVDPTATKVFLMKLGRAWVDTQLAEGKHVSISIDGNSQGSVVTLHDMHLLWHQLLFSRLANYDLCFVELMQGGGMFVVEILKAPLPDSARDTFIDVLRSSGPVTSHLLDVISAKDAAEAHAVIETAKRTPGALPVEKAHGPPQPVSREVLDFFGTVPMMIPPSRSGRDAPATPAHNPLAARPTAAAAAAKAKKKRRKGKGVTDPAASAASAAAAAPTVPGASASNTAAPASVVPPSVAPAAPGRGRSALEDIVALLEPQVAAAMPRTEPAPSPAYALVPPPPPAVLPLRSVVPSPAAAGPAEVPPGSRGEEIMRAVPSLRPLLDPHAPQQPSVAARVAACKLFAEAALQGGSTEAEGMRNLEGLFTVFEKFIKEGSAPGVADAAAVTAALQPLAMMPPAVTQPPLQHQQQQREHAFQLQLRQQGTAITPESPGVCERVIHRVVVAEEAVTAAYDQTLPKTINDIKSPLISARVFEMYVSRVQAHVQRETPVVHLLRLVSESLSVSPLTALCHGYTVFESTHPGYDDVSTPHIQTLLDTTFRREGALS